MKCKINLKLSQKPNSFVQHALGTSLITVTLVASVAPILVSKASCFGCERYHGVLTLISKTSCFGCEESVSKKNLPR